MSQAAIRASLTSRPHAPYGALLTPRRIRPGHSLVGLAGPTRACVGCPLRGPTYNWGPRRGGSAARTSRRPTAGQCKRMGIEAGETCICGLTAPRGREPASRRLEGYCGQESPPRSLVRTPAVFGVARVGPSCTYVRGAVWSLVRMVRSYRANNHRASACRPYGRPRVALGARSPRDTGAALLGFLRGEDWAYMRRDCLGIGSEDSACLVAAPDVLSALEAPLRIPFACDPIGLFVRTLRCRYRKPRVFQVGHARAL